MTLLVQKYGGSSLATLSQLREIASRIASARATGQQLVVVVSARGTTTDDLVGLARELGADAPCREQDQLLATGETASAAQLSIMLNASGTPAASLSGGQAGILSDGPPGSGFIAAIDTGRIRQLVDSGIVVVVAGFQGLNVAGDVQTLGRGASDTTAVALAAELNAAACEIYTDVDGVFTADPRVVPNAELLRCLDLDIMAEMASLGAKVLHSRAVELALARQVTIHVRNSRGNAGGTILPGTSGGEMLEERSRVLAVTHQSDVAVISLSVADRNKACLIDLLQELTSACVSVEIHTKSALGGRSFVEFSVPRTELDTIRKIIEDIRPADSELRLHDAVGRVSLIGVGMATSPDSTVKMLRVLDAAGIPSGSLTSSQSRTSVTVPLPMLTESVVLLHDEFALGAGHSPTDSVPVGSH